MFLQHVFVITANSAIWRSKDGGSTFEDITERFKSECFVCTINRAAKAIKGKPDCQSSIHSRHALGVAYSLCAFFLGLAAAVPADIQLKQQELLADAGAL